MSRTYRNRVRCGICNGSNTEFYRERTRKNRHINRQEIRNKFSRNIDLGDIEKYGIPESIRETEDELTFTKLPKRDNWREPTDGTTSFGRHGLDSIIQDIENDIRGFRPDAHKYMSKYYRVLKPKDRRPKHEKYKKVA